MSDIDRIQRQIQQIQSRIYELNDKSAGVTSESELRKIKKAKDKLFKEKNKLLAKLYPEESDEEIDQNEDIQNSWGKYDL